VKLCSILAETFSSCCHYVRPELRDRLLLLGLSLGNKCSTILLFVRLTASSVSSALGVCSLLHQAFEFSLTLSYIVLGEFSFILVSVKASPVYNISQTP
jgi:hypothetical protein